MGQCPMMPEPVYGCYQKDGNSGIRLGTCGSGRGGDDTSFLVPHRHDLPMRCMLDPTQVYEVIIFQAEILTRQAELLYKDGITEDSSTTTGDVVSEENDYAMSTVAPSAYTDSGRTEVTTFSVATRVTGNHDKYSNPKRKYNRPKPPQRDLKPRDVKKNRGMGGINEKGTSATSAKVSSQQSAARGSSAANILKNPALGSLFVPCIGVKPLQTEFSQEEFYNILQLKMKLNLAEYYQTQYLALFPTSPSPSGFTRRCAPNKRDTAPNLSRISSDNSSHSSATPAIDYGSGVSSSPVRLMADSSYFMDLAVTGSLGLVARAHNVTSSPNSSSKAKSPSHYIVLINRRSGVPLAVCALKSKHGPPVVRIYATRSRVIGQRPAATTEELGLTWTDSYPLFAWAEFTTEGEFPMPARYSLYMASGSDGRFEKEPSYRASHRTTGSPDITMVGRTQTETVFKGCAIFSMISDENDGDPYVSLSISRGIDPALMICFAAIIDETLENTMRLNCELSARRAMRRAHTGSTSSLHSALWR